MTLKNVFSVSGTLRFACGLVALVFASDGIRAQAAPARQMLTHSDSAMSLAGVLQAASNKLSPPPVPKSRAGSAGRSMAVGAVISGRSALGDTNHVADSVARAFDRVCTAAYAEAAKAYSTGGVPSPAALLSTLKCKLTQDNREKCKAAAADRPCGSVALVPDNPNNVDPKNAEAQQVYDVSTPNGIRAACAAIAQSASTAAVDPLLMIIAAPAGAYTCDSYIKAAARRDPMLLIAPALIPAIRLTSDTKQGLDKLVDGIKKNVPAFVAPAAVVATGSYDLASKAVVRVATIVEAVPQNVPKIPTGGPIKPIDVILPTITAPVRLICGLFKKC